MRRQALIGALLLVGVGVVLGATVFRTDIAQATGLAQSVTVNNTPAEAVPVREQNLDGSKIRVHEEGTADVNVTNSSLSVAPQSPITGGGQSVQPDGGEESNIPTQTASALIIGFTAGAIEVVLWKSDDIVGRFAGPDHASGAGSQSRIVLALSRPVSFDKVECFGPATETCHVSWIGNEP